MMEHIKRAVQKPLIFQRHLLYQKRLAEQVFPKEAWIKEILAEEKAEILAWKKKILAEEKNRASAGDKAALTLEAEVVSWQELGYCFQRKEEKIWIVTPHPEKLVQEAVWEVRRYFWEHPEKSIAYGDESGYFKPGWSPELLQSFFYFGCVFAVKQSLLNKAAERFDKRLVWRESARKRSVPYLRWHKPAETDVQEQNVSETDVSEPESEAAMKQALYELVLCCIDEAKEAGYIEKLLYVSQPAGEKPVGEEPDYGEGDWGREPEFDALKKGHLYSDVEIPEEKEKQPLISVIIPSKDNPAVLSHCIHSLLEGTDYENLEIIVIDNGSNEKNKNRILQMQRNLKEEYAFRYLYEPMEFNFSAMCNIGARAAAGEYLLFLNDDIEAAEENWLRLMMKRAAKEGVGAVGAKLLYPSSKRIQHLGITNIHLGPAHKLQFSFDSKTYYHNYNRCSVNVIGVTGACLLLKKSVYEETGGFQERLKVSFNDVEFCFHLQRLGYRNVCCNDTFLYHHESLSRGLDSGFTKIRRMHGESRFLYSRYPEMWNRDRYYSKRLVSDILDHGFHGAYRFDAKRMAEQRKPQRLGKKLQTEWHNECLYIGMEFTGDKDAWETGKPGSGDYYIQGWVYAVNVDNSRYRKKLLLKLLKQEELLEEKEAERQGTEGEIWEIPYEECYRPDMEENLTYIDHPALSGVSLWIPRDSLPVGEYLIGSLWEDTCSRQRLYRFGSETLTVAGE